MMTPTYDPKTTAVLLVDPYNDFLSEGGKLWPLAKPIAEEVGLLDNLLQSCPVSLPAHVSLSAQATGPGILAEIAIPAPQSSAASTLRPACPALLTSPAWPVRVSVGLANVRFGRLAFSTTHFSLWYFPAVAAFLTSALVVNAS
jgi:hypothetical protein